MKKLFTLLTILVMTYGVSQAQVDTIVKWTFHDSTLASAPYPNAGLAANLVIPISTKGGTGAINYKTAGATTYCANAANWTSGVGTKYWQIKVVTTNYSTLKISSKQRSSNTGPRDFKLQYMIGYAGSWTDVPGGTVLDSNSWTKGVINNLDLPAACNNQDTVYIRWVVTSTTAVNGSTVATAGTSRVDDLFIVGTATSVPTLNVAPTALTGFTYMLGSGPSTSQSYNLSGSNLTGAPGNIAVTAPADYEVSLDNTTFTASVNVPYATATLTATPVYTRLKSGLAVATYNSELIINAGGGATTKNVTCSGDVTTPPTPVLTATPTTLTGFTYVLGSGPSASQSYNLSGVNLTSAPGNITVTGSTDYEVSLDNTTFTASVNVPYTSATLASTTVYVRLMAGLSVATYNSEIISNIGGGATSADVTCSGDVTAPPTPVLTATPTTLNGFNYGLGAGPSASQSYDLSGANLTSAPGNITVTGSTDYEVSLDNTTFTASVNVPYTSATLSATTVYVRLMAGLAVATYNAETISNVGGGATSADVTCNGDVTLVPTPVLTATPTTLTGFTYVFGSGPSVSQSYSLSGVNLTGAPDNITVTAPADYEVSLDNTTFTASVNVPYTSATLAATTVYVRLLSGLSVAAYNSELVTNAGGGAVTADVTCSGDVTAVPTPILTATPTTLTGFSYTLGSGPSTSQSYTISGTDLTGAPGNIVVTAPTDYEVSLDNTTFTASVNVPFTTATLTATPVYVRLTAGLAVAAYNSEIVTNVGGGATSADVTCSGDVTSALPCLSEDFSGFTTGSHASPGTTDLSATLDTYTQTTGWTGLKIYSAGGEIKLGTSTSVGYIVTKTIDLSTGDANLSFDLQRYGNDSTNKVIVYHAPDGITFTAIDSLKPTVNYSTHTTLITGGTATSKIKIGTSAKRAFLDNISVMCGVIVSVAENTENTSVNIYPNPVSDNLTIAVDGQTKDIIIYDMLGNIVYNNYKPVAVNTVNAGNLNKGMYFVKITFNNNTSITRKITVM